ncbi:unnamed protein product [Allacma fusca]|uniref:Uncharacterized protein n=1 Tax=Allacma fusca TaxID=39272 RepID=A0A8J2JSX4_9HEXA|nr:unnamed protein product [Allacma fusca]
MLCFRRKNFWGPSHGNRNGGSGSSSLDSTLASSPTNNAPSSAGAPGQGKNGLKSGRIEMEELFPADYYNEAGLYCTSEHL